jgi:hypothetical protein
MNCENMILHFIAITREVLTTLLAPYAQRIWPGEVVPGKTKKLHKYTCSFPPKPCSSVTGEFDDHSQRVKDLYLLNHWRPQELRRVTATARACGFHLMAPNLSIKFRNLDYED